ncbi:hypothetical protein [Staphylococcus pettenkoferi]|uniref:hypothetical protein n=1 Tax=Staphylococcus pettenkoferi TaxID=170573 RepID=UPI002274E11F|nr:hypothetical protein [Staphylococcus pettenkoferi]MCY1563855.1 hypothetical protein [Staphylococcus pettenkoferi]
MKISDVFLTLKACYTDAQGTDYQDNQKIFVEMGWAMRRLIDSNQLSFVDDFDDEEIKQMIYEEMQWEKFNVN